MLHRIGVMVMLALLLAACGKSREEELQEQHSKGAEVVEDQAALIKGAGDALKKDGKDAAESISAGVGSLIKGVAGGVDQVQSDFKVSVSEGAKKQALSVTRIVMSDATSSAGKGVKVYVTSAQAFKGRLQLRAFDGKNIEIGRSGKVDSALEADDALYVEFLFDNATPLSRVDHFVVHAL